MPMLLRPSAESFAAVHSASRPALAAVRAVEPDPTPSPRVKWGRLWLQVPQGVWISALRGARSPQGLVFQSSAPRMPDLALLFVARATAQDADKPRAAWDGTRELPALRKRDVSGVCTQQWGICSIGGSMQAARCNMSYRVATCRAALRRGTLSRNVLYSLASATYGRWECRCTQCSRARARSTGERTRTWSTWSWPATSPSTSHSGRTSPRSASRRAAPPVCASALHARWRGTAGRARAAQALAL